MTRLWRATTLVLVVATLIVGPGVAAFATDGGPDGRGEMARDHVSDRAPVAPVRDGTPAPNDQVRDREQDRVGDRETDRVRDRLHRPECDPDRVTDRVHDCRPANEIRPALARCIEYVQSQTDRTIRRSLRWWWHVCHRLAASHTDES